MLFSCYLSALYIYILCAEILCGNEEMVFITTDLIKKALGTEVRRPVPIPIGSVLGTLGRFGLAGAGFTLGQRLLGGLFGGEEEKHRKRRRKGIVVYDEEGNVVDVIPIRKKKPKRYPKFVYEVMKSQAKMVENMANFLQFMMFRDIANHNNHD